MARTTGSYTYRVEAPHVLHVGHVRGAKRAESKVLELLSGLPDSTGGWVFDADGECVGKWRVVREPGYVHIVPLAPTAGERY